MVHLQPLDYDETYEIEIISPINNDKKKLIPEVNESYDSREFSQLELFNN